MSGWRHPFESLLGGRRAPGSGLAIRQKERGQLKKLAEGIYVITSNFALVKSQETSEASDVWTLWKLENGAFQVDGELRLQKAPSKHPQLPIRSISILKCGLFPTSSSGESWCPGACGRRQSSSARRPTTTERCREPPAASIEQLHQVSLTALSVPLQRAHPECKNPARRNDLPDLAFSVVLRRTRRPHRFDP